MIYIHIKYNIFAHRIINIINEINVTYIIEISHWYQTNNCGSYSPFHREKTTPLLFMFCPKTSKVVILSLFIPLIGSIWHINIVLHEKGNENKKNHNFTAYNCADEKKTNEILVDLQQQSRLTNSGILKVGFEADWVAVNSGKSQSCTLLLPKIAS